MGFQYKSQASGSYGSIGFSVPFGTNCGRDLDTWLELKLT